MSKRRQYKQYLIDTDEDVPRSTRYHHQKRFVRQCLNNQIQVQSSSSSSSCEASKDGQDPDILPAPQGNVPQMITICYYGKF